MKSVLISIQPRWCELIANGKKTVEVRKTRPKLDTPFKCYIYCTNTKPYLAWGDEFRGGSWETVFSSLRGYSKKDAERIFDIFNGKVIGEFVCDDIDAVMVYNNLLYCERNSQPNKLKQMCLSLEEVGAYLGEGKCGYNWHISDLVIYDKPKELGEFFRVGHSEYCKSEWEERERFRIQLDKHNEITGDKAHLNTDSDFENILKMLSPFKMKRPPQSWGYVEEVKANDKR